MSLELIHEIQFPSKVNSLCWNQNGTVLAAVTDFSFSVYRVSSEIELVFSRKENSEILRLFFVEPSSSDILVFLKNKTVYYANESSILIELDMETVYSDLLYLRHLSPMEKQLRPLKSFGEVDTAFLDFLENRADKLALNIAFYNNTVLLLLNGIVKLTQFDLIQPVLSCSSQINSISLVTEFEVIKADFSLLTDESLIEAVQNIASLETIEYLLKMTAFFKKLSLKKSFELKKKFCERLDSDISKIGYVKEKLMEAAVFVPNIEELGSILDSFVFDKNINNKTKNNLFYFLQTLEEILTDTFIPCTASLLAVKEVKTADIISILKKAYQQVNQVKQDSPIFFEWLISVKDNKEAENLDVSKVLRFISSNSFVLGDVSTVLTAEMRPSLVKNEESEIENKFASILSPVPLEKEPYSIIKFLNNSKGLLKESKAYKSITLESNIPRTELASINFKFEFSSAHKQNLLFLSEKTVRIFNTTDSNWTAVQFAVEPLSVALTEHGVLCQTVNALYTADGKVFSSPKPLESKLQIGSFLALNSKKTILLFNQPYH